MRTTTKQNTGSRNPHAGRFTDESGTQPKLLDRLRLALRSRHYSRKTEQTYCHWVKKYIYFHNVKHPDKMGEKEINAFLTHLAVKERVSSSTQNQALCALLFLYRHVLGREVGDLGDVIRAKKPVRLPVVLTRDEVRSVLQNLSGDKWLIASVMYGGGLRLMECLRLRVQDIDFQKNFITVRNGKGNKDRITMLPTSIKDRLIEHMRQAKKTHENDIIAMAIKYGHIGNFVIYSIHGKDRWTHT